MSFDVGVTKRLGEVEITLRFEAADGAMILFGRSGVGKTSVLNMVAGLLRPDAGHVRVGGRTLFDSASRIDVPGAKRRSGYVFQEPRLFPHLRVRANLLYGATDDGGLAAMSRMLDIGHLLQRWPATLSGGQARRVAIGRALLSDPAFLLLDEPTASLDEARADEVLRAIERVRDEAGLPILMVTHDLAEAERIGARIVRM